MSSSYDFDFRHHNHETHARPQQRKEPTNPVNTSNGREANRNVNANSLDTASIVFIVFGCVTVLIVLIVCITLWIKSSRRKPNYRAPTQVVGRAIQRPSFFPFRFSRRMIEPEIIYCPSPDGTSINYPIVTPYSFRTTWTDSQNGSPKPMRSVKTHGSKNSISRATII